MFYESGATDLLRFRSSEAREKPPRILLVRTDRLGDVILTLPMLAALRSCFPDAYLAMLLRHYTGEIVTGNPHVDELIWYDEGSSRLIPFGAMRRTLRERHFDAAIVVYPTPRLAWLMFLAGIPLRVATGYRYYSLLFNRRVYEHRKDAKRHEVEYNLNLLKRIGCTGEGKPDFTLSIPEEAEHGMRGVLRAAGMDPGRPLIVLHPGSGGSGREWPAESFGALGARLVREFDVQIALTGTEQESETVEAVRAGVPHRAYSLAGRLNVKELGALLRAADLFIGNSTGPIHIASAVGTPVVGLYSQVTAMSPRRWGPYTDKKRVLVPARPADCRECLGGREDRCACMGAISVEDAFQAARELLRTGKNVKGAGISHVS